MSLWSDLLNVFLPRLCPICGQPMNDGEVDFCTFCRGEMPLTHQWLTANNPLTEMLAGRLPLVTASAMMFYRSGNNAQKAIHRMKYFGNSDMAHNLGRMYGRLLSQSVLYKGVNILVPVPLHGSRLIKRGYNQSDYFCRGMALEMGIKVEHHALRRVRRTKTQALRSSKNARWSNVEGAFCLVHPELLAGKGVMLIDDVITTGATIEACARAIGDQLPEQKLWIGGAAMVRGSKKH